MIDTWIGSNTTAWMTQGFLKNAAKQNRILVGREQLPKLHRIGDQAQP